MAKEAGLDVGHITSLRPLRPENLPDAWERTALLGFEAGKKESSGLDYISGAEYFRLMRPFLVEASCLKCHASQGYRVGEIRGGIRSSVPMAPLYAVEKRVRTRLSLAHGFIWLVGLAGIVFAIGRLSARVRQARSAELRADREREKSERYLAIAAEIILALDPDGKVALLNESGYRLLGHETGTLDGKDWFAACLPEASRRETADYFGKLRRGETDEMVREGPVVTNEGAVRQVLWRTVALRDGDGGFAGTLSSGTDITERRQAEEAISESEKRFRSLFENMLEGFAYCKMLYDGGVPVDFIYLEVNAAFKTLTGLKDVTGKKASHVIPGVRDSDPELFEIYGRVARTGTPESFELYLKALDMWLAISVYSPGKEHFVAVFDVITERKRAEENIRSLLSEKEILLKEVHHRVKNNMAMIGGLLALQATRLSDPGAVKALQESSGRVNGMAMMYDLLYQSRDFRYVKAREYIGQIVCGIAQSLPPVPGVKVEQRVEDFIMDSRVLFPIGIIINELVTNAYKYAFPEGRTGTITVSMSRLPDNHVRLSVLDDGIGVPESFDCNGQTGFGMKMVGLMARQIEGTLECVRGKGTEFRVDFQYGDSLHGGTGDPRNSPLNDSRVSRSGG